MTWRDFWAKAKTVVLNVYHWVYAEVGTLLSLLKSPDKTKYSSKRVAGVALIANGIWMLRLAKNLFDAVIAGGQVIVGVILLVVAAATKT